MASDRENPALDAERGEPVACATGHSGRLPDFLVVGGMKCGSTTLHGHLSNHPDLFLCSPKEPQFFSRDAVFSRGLDWYRSLFEEAGERLCGEASTCYSRAPHFGDVAKRIHAHLPDAKLMYLVRHPVDRAYSHYRHEAQVRMIEGSAPVPSFEEMLEETSELLDTSDYWLQLQQYLAYYPREQIHVIRLEDLQARPGEVLDGAQRFLGVRCLGTSLIAQARSNAFGDKLARHGMHDLLDSIRNAGILRAAIDCVPAGLRAQVRVRLTDPRVARYLLSRLIRARGQTLEPMRPETRKLLLNRFSEPNRALESFLGVGVPEWSV